MSAIETVLSRMMSDSAFAGEVFTNPDKALAEYKLSAEDLTQLKGMSRTDFEMFTSASPEERKSMALSKNHNQSALYVNR